MARPGRIPAVALAAYALAALAPSADASFPGANGPIIFESNRDDANGEIYSVPGASGGAAARLTTNTIFDGEPSFSADGTEIVFASQPGSDYEIWTMARDGSNPLRTVFSTGFDFRNPAYSPTTNAGVGDVGSSDVYKAVKPSTLVNLTPSTSSIDVQPAWSPDGTKIAFSTDRDGNGEIYTMDTDGNGLVDLTNTPSANESWPDWSPDGSLIAYVSDATGFQEIWIMDADGSDQTPITTTAGTNLQPVWSPDGTMIAFATFDGNDTEIAVIDEGGTVTPITNTNADEGNPSWGRALAAPPPPPPPPPVAPPPPPPPPPPTAAIPPPVAGVSAIAGPVSGTILIKKPGTTKFVQLAANGLIPIGTVVNATKGVVRISASVGGRVSAGDFSGGVFKLVQRKSANAIPELQLQGGQAAFKRCSVSKTRAKASARPKTIRRLFGKAKGRFTTRGRYAAATVRGTEWTVADRCDGTLTTVKSGRVSVRDLVKRKTVLVRARKSYLAKPRARR